MQHILSATQFNKKDIEQILSQATKMEAQCKSGKIKKVLQDKIVACLFFEASTRTRLSFETAALKLGAGVITAENAMENTSTHKGESIEDTTRIVCNYADILVMRHPKEGMPQRAAVVAHKPIINAGDGGNQHPTQGLLDVYTILKEKKRLENLNIAIVGDLLYGRTIHSTLTLLSNFPNNKFYFVSPKALALPQEFKKILSDKKNKIIETETFKDIFKVADMVYMTRVQEERFTNKKEYEKYKSAYILNNQILTQLKSDVTVMHALPRITEISTEIDKDPRAAYFRQAQNGLYIRMALLKMVLDK